MQAYAKAAQALRALEHPIDSGAQAKAIKGIGAGMANRIDAARLQEMHQESHDRATIHYHTISWHMLLLMHCGQSVASVDVAFR